jgi:hypothetical protein
LVWNDFWNCVELLMHAVAMRRPRETVQNDGELARSCRAAVMAIERANEARARWAGMRLASRIGMLSPRIFNALNVVVLGL